MTASVRCPSTSRHSPDGDKKAPPVEGDGGGGRGLVAEPVLENLLRIIRH